RDTTRKNNSIHRHSTPSLTQHPRTSHNTPLNITPHITTHTTPHITHTTPWHRKDTP
ncbi:hypothetical protein NDU88_000058, partial [Pleurodeles waltl]